MLSWYLGLGALVIWLAATLLYLRRPIVAWVVRRMEGRAAARKQKPALTQAPGPPHTP
jgi:hypothetical protein